MEACVPVQWPVSTIRDLFTFRQTVVWIIPASPLCETPVGETQPGGPVGETQPGWSGQGDPARKPGEETPPDAVLPQDMPFG